MKYYQWPEKEVLMMSYDKLLMYLASIPDFSTDDEEGEEKGKPKKQQVTQGSFNLFDFDEKF